MMEFLLFLIILLNVFFMKFVVVCDSVWIYLFNMVFEWLIRKGIFLLIILLCIKLVIFGMVLWSIDLMLEVRLFVLLFKKMMFCLVRFSGFVSCWSCEFSYVKYLMRIRVIMFRIINWLWMLVVVCSVFCLMKVVRLLIWFCFDLEFVIVFF